ncbi:MAG: DUF2141 domain-containing protein [Bacteroidales bacterium]|nr:DUF2141 domain-containing protein [Bacteroidales bacterium]
MPLSSNKTGTISITIENIESNEGQIIIGLCNSKDSYPKKPIIRKIIIIENGETKLEIPNIAYGKYAISVIHDENSNGKLDFYFFGPPKEKTAASNNPKNTFGPPSWEESNFILDKENISINISL